MYIKSNNSSVLTSWCWKIKPGHEGWLLNQWFYYNLIYLIWELQDLQSGKMCPGLFSVLSYTENQTCAPCKCDRCWCSYSGSSRYCTISLNLIIKWPLSVPTGALLSYCQSVTAECFLHLALQSSSQLAFYLSTDCSVGLGPWYL